MYIKILLLLLLLLLLFVIYRLIILYRDAEQFQSISLLPICNPFQISYNEINYGCPVEECRFKEEKLIQGQRFWFDYMFKMLCYPLCVIKIFYPFVDRITLSNLLKKNYNINLDNLLVQENDLLLGRI